MRNSSESVSTSAERDVIVTAYENLCAAIAAADPSVQRVDDLTIRRLERTIEMFSSRTDSARTSYVHLPQAIARATEIIEWLDGMRRDESVVVLNTRALLRGELRRLLGSIQFIHVTGSDLAEASATIAASKRRANAMLVVFRPAAAVNVAPRKRRATRMLDRVAAAVQGQVFGEGLVLAQV